MTTDCTHDKLTRQGSLQHPATVEFPALPLTSLFSCLRCKSFVWVKADEFKNAEWEGVQE